MGKLFCVVCSLFLLCALVVDAKPPEAGEKKAREMRDGNISEEKHYHEGGEHNADYDHETFLGKEKKSFEQLTPEESKERLGTIVDKIDKDHDGKVTKEELADWIKFTRKQNLYEAVDKRWNDFKKREEIYWSRKHGGSAKKKIDRSEPVSWELYQLISFGPAPEKDEHYKEEVRLDERRWKNADLDKDNKLSKEEFAAIIQPWDFDHMKDVVAMETLEEVDDDKDGYVSVEEYMVRVFQKKREEMTQEELKQYDNEAKHFARARDLSKDGKMDKFLAGMAQQREPILRSRQIEALGVVTARDEVKEWVFPSDYDFAKADAEHLIRQADTNGDKDLTKEEILDKYTVFVGSRATNYGQDLTRHDEF